MSIAGNICLIVGIIAFISLCGIVYYNMDDKEESKPPLPIEKKTNLQYIYSKSEFISLYNYIINMFSELTVNDKNYNKHLKRADFFQYETSYIQIKTILLQYKYFFINNQSLNYTKAVLELLSLLTPDAQKRINYAQNFLTNAEAPLCSSTGFSLK